MFSLLRPPEHVLIKDYVVFFFSLAHGFPCMVPPATRALYAQGEPTRSGSGGGGGDESMTGEMMDMMRDTSDAELARAISLSLQDCRINGEGTAARGK